MASPLTTAQQVRLRIQDPFRFRSEMVRGDGSASAYKLQEGAPYSHLSATPTASIFTAAATTGWSATGATFDLAKGTVVFAGGAVSANSGLQVDYYWSVFSDDELGHFTAVDGSVAGASREAVRTLMFDAYKRNRWAAPDGTTVDDKETMRNLVLLYSALETEVLEGGPEGGIESWAVEQENY